MSLPSSLPRRPGPFRPSLSVLPPAPQPFLRARLRFSSSFFCPYPSTPSRCRPSVETRRHSPVPGPLGRGEWVQEVPPRARPPRPACPAPGTGHPRPPPPAGPRPSGRHWYIPSALGDSTPTPPLLAPLGSTPAPFLPRGAGWARVGRPDGASAGVGSEPESTSLGVLRSRSLFTEEVWFGVSARDPSECLCLTPGVCLWRVSIADSGSVLGGRVGTVRTL